MRSSDFSICCKEYRRKADNAKREKQHCWLTTVRPKQMRSYHHCPNRVEVHLPSQSRLLVCRSHRSDSQPAALDIEAITGTGPKAHLTLLWVSLKNVSRHVVLNPRLIRHREWAGTGQLHSHSPGRCPALCGWQQGGWCGRRQAFWMDLQCCKSCIFILVWPHIHQSHLTGSWLQA